MKYLFFSNDGKLGDAIVHTIFVEGVLQNDKNAELHCTVGGFNKYFWNKDNRIKKTWIIDKPSLFEVIIIGLKLRKLKFDYIIIWNNIKSEKIRLLIWLANIKNKIISLEIPNKHISIRDNNALNKIFKINCQYKYSISESLIKPIEYKNYILLNLFAGDVDYSRSLTTNNAIKIINEVLNIFNNNILIVLNCHNNTEIFALDISNRYKKNVIVKNCSKDVRDLIGLVYNSNFVISTDSAIVHIACAFNKDILCFYKNNNNEIIKWRPIGVNGVTYLSKYENLNFDFPNYAVKNFLEKFQGMRYYYNDGSEFSDLINEIKSPQLL